MINVDATCLAARTADAAETTDRRLKTEQRGGHAVSVCLVHPRVRLASPTTCLPDGIRPALSVEEPRGPCPLASIQWRNETMKG